MTVTSPFRSVAPGATHPGLTPAIVLHDPRFARNVGVAVRAASCYGAPQVWFTGERVGFKDLAELEKQWKADLLKAD